MNKQNDPNVFSAMQVNEPVSAYRKTILGMVAVNILNPFSQEPETILLTGQPNSDTAIVKFWSVPEELFFKRMNKSHLLNGILIPYDFAAKPVEEFPSGMEQASDEDLRKIVNSKFFTLQNALANTNAEALVFRMLNLAREEEKSEKYIKAIEGRLAELQSIKVNKEEES